MFKRFWGWLNCIFTPIPDRSEPKAFLAGIAERIEVCDEALVNDGLQEFWSEVAEDAAYLQHAQLVEEALSAAVQFGENPVFRSAILKVHNAAVNSVLAQRDKRLEEIRQNRF